MEDVACQTIMAICQVSPERARELLEAATGSVEQAVNIHFMQSTNLSSDLPQSESPDAKRPQPLGEPSSSPLKAEASKTIQKTASPKPQKQRKIDSFFPPTSSHPFGDKVEDGSCTSADIEDLESISKKPQSVGPQSLSKSFAEVRKTTAIRLDDAQLPDTKAAQKNPPGTEEEILTRSLSHSACSISYVFLANKLAEMTATAKRNTKLQSLKKLFGHVINVRAGLAGERNSPGVEHISRELTCVLQLVLGKIEIHSTDDASSGGPVNRSLPLQVSGSSVSAAIQTVTGTSRSQIRQAYRKMGDLGDVAAEFQVAKSVESYFVQIKPASSLTVEQVHSSLVKIATVPQGKGSQATRQNLMVNLLRRCKDKEEIRFIVRTLLGNMRVGATIKSVLAGLAMAFEERENGTESLRDSSMKSVDAVQRLQKVYCVCPRLNEIARALLEGGISFAERTCSLVVGFPVEPMLANPAQALDQVSKFLQGEEAVAEWKYDGVRCQAHWDGKNARLFSRHLLECTDQYPDAVQYLLEARRPHVSTFVVDTEIVGVVPTTDNQFRFLPFQELSTRRSTVKGEPDAAQIQIRVYAFDLMYLNGVSLLEHPQHARQAQLYSHFTEHRGFGFAQSITLPRYDESLVQSALQNAANQGAEGLMIKLTGRQCDSNKKGPARTYGYEAGTRSQLWLKLKKDYVKGFFETVDVVPIGAWFGNGRKAQKEFWSPILLAVYDEDEGTFQSVSRCMSFSDSMYSAIREFYEKGTPYPSGVGVDDLEKTNDEMEAAQGIEEGNDAKSTDDEKDIPNTNKLEKDGTNADGYSQRFEDDYDRINCFPARPPSTVVMTNENATLWLKPMEVWEVAFADLTLSRTHTASWRYLEDPDQRGISLRFPRFKRRRPDKSVEQATTTRQLAQLYAAQSKIKVTKLP